jgi:hypothetical protein
MSVNLLSEAPMKKRIQMSTISRSLLALVVCLSGPAVASAQGLTTEERTVRPGDTLTWTTGIPHRLRFGGNVTHNGKSIPVTSFKEIDQVLEFDAKPTIDAQGVARWPSGKPVTARVRPTAAASGVKEFFFTCGFDQHADMMVTVSFIVEAAGVTPVKKVEISSAGPPNGPPPRWLLKTATGDKNLKRP